MRKYQIVDKSLSRMYWSNYMALTARSRKAIMAAGAILTRISFARSARAAKTV